MVFSRGSRSSAISLQSVWCFLLTVNVRMNSSDQYQFDDPGKRGWHWLFFDLDLASHSVDCHDWVNLATVEYELVFRPMLGFIREMHNRCEGLCTAPALPGPARVLHLQDQDNNYDCGIFAMYMVFVVSRPDYIRQTPRMERTNTFDSQFCVGLVQNLTPSTGRIQTFSKTNLLFPPDVPRMCSRPTLLTYPCQLGADEDDTRSAVPTVTTEDPKQLLSSSKGYVTHTLQSSMMDRFRLE
jgi:hypothetical protein